MSTLQTELADKVVGKLVLVPSPKQTVDLEKKIQQVIDTAEKVVRTVKGSDSIERDLGAILLSAKEEAAITWLQSEGTKRFSVLVMGIMDDKFSRWEIRLAERINVNKILGRLRKRECSARRVKLAPEEHHQLMDLRPLAIEGASSWNYEPNVRVILSSRIGKERPVLTYRDILSAIEFELGRNP